MRPTACRRNTRGLRDRQGRGLHPKLAGQAGYAARPVPCPGTSFRVGVGSPPDGRGAHERGAGHGHLHLYLHRHPLGLTFALRLVGHRRGYDSLYAPSQDVPLAEVASVYLGPHQLLVTAEVQPLDAISSLRLRQLLAELRGRVTEAIPRAALVFLTPVVAVEPPPEPTPWDPDYWLRRFPDHEQA